MRERENCEHRRYTRGEDGREENTTTKHDIFNSSTPVTTNITFTTTPEQTKKYEPS
jgi:hypothetical protein